MREGGFSEPVLVRQGAGGCFFYCRRELEEKSVKEYRDEIEEHLFYMFAQLY